MRSSILTREKVNILVIIELNTLDPGGLNKCDEM